MGSNPIARSISLFGPPRTGCEAFSQGFITAARLKCQGFFVADLHLHSNVSDGADPPRRVMARAKAAGLRTVSLTDHDSMNGLAEARAEAERLGMEFIDGVEISARHAERLVHVLGHFVRPGDPVLSRRLAGFQTLRRERMDMILDKLAGMGAGLDREDFYRFCGEAAITRGQLMAYLLKNGKVRSKGEALSRFLGEDAPAYVPVGFLAPAEAVEIIRSAGGAATFAHPVLSAVDDILPELVGAGLAGIEVDHPAQNEEARRHYRALADKYSLVPTGGSDCHGGRVGPERIGTVRMPLERVEMLRERTAASV